ncbi:MAG: hypothetical protein RLZ77_1972 [Bacteroidota bacterium]|jgi:hypothetical protein
MLYFCDQNSQIMIRIISKYILLGAVVLFSNCGSTSKIEALKPVADNAAPLLYDATPSYINMPISIKLQDVENQINKSLAGLIYDDNTIEDDNLEVKIWKQAAIQIQNEAGKIKTVLPLKAQIKYRIGTSKLGIDLYDTREFNFNGVITLVSDVHMANWKLATQTDFRSLDWNESPSVTVFGKAVPITYLINPAVKLFKAKIEKTIDNAIATAVDFKPNVLAALEKITTPFEMNKTYQTWLSITPQELYATDAQVQKKAIHFDLGFKCLMETRIGQQPASKFDKNKIALKTAQKIPNAVAANVVAVSTYDNTSRIMTENFKGQEFGNGKKKVTVQNVSLWHKEGKLIIALDLLGSVNGTVYLSGIPAYNPETKEVYFEDLDYVIDTKNRLMKTASWLAQGLILKKMQENCRYSIQGNLEEGKQNLVKYMKNYSPMPGVFVNGNLNSLDFQKIQLTNQALLAFVKITGDVKVTVDGIK